MGDIGRERREVEFEPLPLTVPGPPLTVPRPVPAPQPVPEPVPVGQPA
jgi:hypothetical protein